jgi:hypothetical protein
LFDTFIARNDCILGMRALRSHPNVRHVTLLPRDWVLYEFHHELFQDPDFLVERVWQEKMQRQPELRQSRIEMLNQERSLLAPWYAKKNKLGDADGLLVSEICQYRVSTLGPMKWLHFEMPAGWGKGITFALGLEAASNAKSAAVLSDFVQEWVDASQGKLSIPAGLEPTAHGFILRGKCGDNMGHWLASLWVLLSDGRWKSGVRNMTLTLDEGLTPLV